MILQVCACVCVCHVFVALHLYVCDVSPPERGRDKKELFSKPVSRCITASHTVNPLCSISQLGVRSSILKDHFPPEEGVYRRKCDSLFPPFHLLSRAPTPCCGLP